MDSVGGVSNMAAVEASLVQSADNDTDKSAKLLKKAMQADKDVVDKLLPAPGEPGSSLNVEA